MELGEEVVAAALKDWRTAPISKALRAVLGLLEKLTRSPEQVAAADIAPLREAGVADPAIEDVIQICAGFQVINRIADALEFDVPSPERLARAAPIMYRMGYGGRRTGG